MQSAFEFVQEGECFSLICTHRWRVSSEVNTRLGSQTLDDSEHVGSDNNEGGESLHSDTCVFRLTVLTHKSRSFMPYFS